MARNIYNPTANDQTPDTGVVLLLQVPRTNDKKELAAEQMFASLFGLLTIPAKGLFQTVIRERISFEIAVIKQRIGFYIWVPTYLKNYVEEQMYAQYPSVQISEVPDYTMVPDGGFSSILVSELKLTQNDVLPIKTFQSFEVDPLAAITATFAKFDQTEEAWVQVVMKPAPQNWHRKSERYIAKTKGGGGSKTSMTGLMKVLWEPPSETTTAAKPAEYESVKAKGAEEKSQKLAFETQIRVVYRGHGDDHHGRLRLQSIIASYKQFNTTYLNGFDNKRVMNDPFILGLYRDRAFNRGGYIMNIEEVATLCHLPHTNVETPYILWASSQTAEPPANLPIVGEEPTTAISPVATTNFRGHNTMFGMPRMDRSRHLYIIGQTGVGKSGFLELLTISDIYSPYGFAIIDPHGDYAINTLKRIPAERAADVIYFNPADTEFPMAFNPMEVTDPKLKTHTASELIGVLKRMFDSWGPRLEYILRYSLLALLDYPEATMLDITRILTEKKFRMEVLRHVQDPVVRTFWTVEFASWNDKFAAEAVAPVLNKVGAFTANPLVRNIIGQPKSSFNVRRIMDDKKILIVNLTRGLLGEDNASILGALLVTKIQLAAMSRADLPAEQRTPFYLYVDEFQNFATDSFATILSEARKYGLNLTVANQYTAQMAIEVKDAVFGNVGSIVAFRMGADDARTMLRYFEPHFEEYDLVHMHNRHFVISMTIEGEKTAAFSAISLNLPPGQTDYSEDIIAHSRAQFASSKEVVQRYVNDRYQIDTFAAQDAPRPLQNTQAVNRPAKVVKQSAPAGQQTGVERRPAQIQKQARPDVGSKPAPSAASQSSANQEVAPAARTAAQRLTRILKTAAGKSFTVPTGVIEPPGLQRAVSHPAMRPDSSSLPKGSTADEQHAVGEQPNKPKRKRVRKRKRKTNTESLHSLEPTVKPARQATSSQKANNPPQHGLQDGFDQEIIVKH